MEKKLTLLFSAAALALASCTNDVYLGQEMKTGTGTGNNSIAFSGETGNMTRTAAGTAETFTQFVVEGYKTVNGANSLVFDDYVVEYAQGTTSDSNTKGWEYVGKGENSNQTIKYWDAAASSYTFVAYSLGAENATNGNATASAIDNTKLGSSEAAVTLTGTPEQLQRCYVSNVNVTETENFATTKNDDDAAAKAVQMTFKRMCANVQLGFYETIPGYSVTNIRFYENGTTSDTQDEPALYADDNVFPADDDANCEMNVAYPSMTNGAQPVVTFSGTGSTALLKYSTALPTGNISTTAPEATNTGTDDLAVLPMEAGALTLRVDLQLKANEGEEVINIQGATAVIPAIYTNWQPNYHYTYIFKITDKLQSETPLGPITFDAVIEESEEGNQETITTVSSPSITTYQAGTTGEDEYKAGTIDVTVEGTGINVSNLKAYTVAVTPENADVSVSESVCIKAAYNETDPLKSDGVTLTDVTSSALNTSKTPAKLTVAVEEGKTEEIYVVVYGAAYAAGDSDAQKAAKRAAAVAKVIKVVSTTNP